MWCLREYNCTSWSLFQIRATHYFSFNFYNHIATNTHQTQRLNILINISIVHHINNTKTHVKSQLLREQIFFFICSNAVQNVALFLFLSAQNLTEIAQF